MKYWSASVGDGVEISRLSVGRPKISPVTIPMGSTAGGGTGSTVTVGIGNSSAESTPTASTIWAPSARATTGDPKVPAVPIAAGVTVWSWAASGVSPGNTPAPGNRVDSGY